MTGQKTDVKVAVLMGGLSNERDVSIKSGMAVVEGLREAGMTAVPFDVQDERLTGLQKAGADVAFLALHGAFGEDGAVQEMLEQMGLPYTGSGPEASYVGMDKAATKSAFVRHSIPTAGYFVARHGRKTSQVAHYARDLGYPLVCKPVCGGSSIGVSIVRGEADLDAALAQAWAEDDRAMLEMYVHGREMTVGVLEGRPLPMIELVSDREFFDFEAKYEDANTDYVTPVAMLPTIYRRATDAAVRAYHALRCRHMARVDLLYGHDGRLYVLEVNTIPGFTPRSLLPMAADHAGVGFPELCARIVRAALRDAAEQRHRRRLIA
jgi:D-alanine-D-alanine ligase